MEILRAGGAAGRLLREGRGEVSGAGSREGKGRALWHNVGLGISERGSPSGRTGEIVRARSQGPQTGGGAIQSGPASPDVARSNHWVRMAVRALSGQWACVIYRP